MTVRLCCLLAHPALLVVVTELDSWPEPAATACESCGPGSFAAEPGTARCDLAQAGYYVPENDSRAAVGSLATLPLPAFGLEAVSTAPAHFGAYLAEAILTGEDGVPATQRGKRLVLPEKMVKAAAAHDWRAVDWEELVLLVKEALEPVKYTLRVPPGEEWTSILRAPDLRTYGRG